MFIRRTLLAVLLVALVLPTAVSATSTSGLSAPAGLKAFLLRYDEPVKREFPRTPSFAWAPVKRAVSYDFELATDSDFRENSIVWSTTSLAKPLTAPVVAVPLSLPWTTGNPYSLYVRVRAVTQTGTTPWSSDYGFNVRWPKIPTSLTAPSGLLRWTPVDGATAYEVWERKIYGSNTTSSWSKWYFVTTNVTDMRDWYTFHQDSSWTTTASWRVRAVRMTYGSALNDLNGASYGPWSPIYTTTNPTPSISTGALTVGGTVSDLTGTVASPKAHGLMPGLYWTGNRSLLNEAVELYRAYVFSDHDCIHPVYKGAIVGSPAWVPRMSGPLNLPKNPTELAKARSVVLEDGGPESFAYSADYELVEATEGVAATSTSSGSSGSSSSPGTGTTIVSPSTLTNPFEKNVVLDLWDRAWPSGAYFWTVVPVDITPIPVSTTTLAAPARAGDTTVLVNGALSSGDVISIGSETALVVVSVSGSTVTLNRALAYAHAAGETVTIASKFEYRELELPQEACSADRVATFGKVSQAAAAGGKTPYVTGLAPNGKLQTASGTSSPKVYGTVLAAWRPALSADSYELQWSKASYPFKAVGQVFTASTSATLSLNPGTWYYRVRGINFQLPQNARAMAWSKIQKVVVAPPIYVVTGSRKSPK